MTVLARRRRVFDSVFPPGESPFLSGIVAGDQVRLDQQRLWDVVTHILQPNLLRGMSDGSITAECMSLILLN